MEAERLKAMQGSEAVDTGVARLGREMNERDRILCPRDTSLMVRIVDPSQPHIHLETCAVCNGTFFDAGEFRDWKEETFGDLLRRLFARPRE